jgi:hypothetical protein
VPPVLPDGSGIRRLVSLATQNANGAVVRSTNLTFLLFFFVYSPIALNWTMLVTFGIVVTVVLVAAGRGVNVGVGVFLGVCLGVGVGEGNVGDGGGPFEIVKE